MPTVKEIVENYIQTPIRKVIENVLIDKFEEINLLKDFLTTAVKSVNQI